MASKAMLFVLASFLVITTRVSSNSEELFVKYIYPTPPVKPSATPPPTPAIKASPPPPPIYKPVPVPPPVKKLPPPPPLKASPPPPVHTPVPAPPVKKPPLPLPPPPPVYTPVPAPPVKKPPLPLPPPPPVKARAPPSPPRNTKECYPLCVVRCKLHSRKNVCLRACVTCCDRCKCVPPGQYGNREKCGKCYANMTTRGGRLKCP